MNCAEKGGCSHPFRLPKGECFASKKQNKTFTLGGKSLVKIKIISALPGPLAVMTVRAA